VDEHSRVEREVAVLRHGQTVNIFAVLDLLDGDDFVVVAVTPAAVVVDAEAARLRFAAGFADVLAVRHLGRLATAFGTFVVGDQMLFATLAVAGD
jgi:hypothetical protein